MSIEKHYNTISLLKPKALCSLLKWLCYFMTYLLLILFLLSLGGRIKNLNSPPGRSLPMPVACHWQIKLAKHYNKLCAPPKLKLQTNSRPPAVPQPPLKRYNCADKFANTKQVFGPNTIILSKPLGMASILAGCVQNKKRGWSAAFAGINHEPNEAALSVFTAVGQLARIRRIISPL